MRAAGLLSLLSLPRTCPMLITYFFLLDQPKEDQMRWKRTKLLSVLYFGVAVYMVADKGPSCSKSTVRYLTSLSSHSSDIHLS